MGSMRGAAFAVSLINGLKSAKEERRNILVKQAEQKKKDEMYKIDKQVAELDLKKRRQQGELDDIGYKVASERLGTLFKAFDARSKAQTMMIDDAESKNRGNILAIDSDLKKLVNSFMPKAGPIDLDFEEDGKDPSGIDKTLGTLANNGITDAKGETYDFLDRKEAENYARSKLGIDWDSKYPRAKKVIDSKHGPSDGLPTKIKKTSEAMEYLVKEVGMEEASAKEWLKKYLSQ